MGARDTVVKEKVKRAKAQQEINDLKSEMERLKRDQVTAFVAKWDKEGLQSVSTTTPITDAEPELHAWTTMKDALADQNNSYLGSVAEDLSAWNTAKIMTKKDPHYLLALVNVAMTERCNAFLETWRERGPKCVGLPKGHRKATTIAEASKHLQPVVNDVTKGDPLHAIMRDLQIMDGSKLMSLQHSCYLQALFTMGERYLVK